jgi:AraC family transcriptional regulator
MEPRIVTRERGVYAGLYRRGRAEGDAIPKLWGAFAARFQELKGVVDQEVSYGLCDNMDEATGEFDYLAAVEMEAGTEIPEGMVAWEVPGGTFAVFTCTLPTLGAAFDGIYKEWLPGSGYERVPGPDMEMYGKSFDPHDPVSEMQILVPVSKA